MQYDILSKICWDTININLCTTDFFSGIYIRNKQHIAKITQRITTLLVVLCESIKVVSCLNCDSLVE